MCARTIILTRAHSCVGPCLWRLRAFVADSSNAETPVCMSRATDWLQLWAANTDMSNPYQFKRNQLVNIGALYSAKLDETLSALALRFRADVRSLLVIYTRALSSMPVFGRNCRVTALYSASRQRSELIDVRPLAKCVQLANPEVTAKDDKLRQDQLICILPGDSLFNVRVLACTLAHAALVFEPLRPDCAHA